MKICVYSEKLREKNNIGWFREGFNIQYLKNSITKECFKNRSYFTLSFQYTFRHSSDSVYFSYAVPYTYT